MVDHAEFLDCGELLIHYSFLYPETRILFHNYLKKMISSNRCIEISVSQEYMDENIWLVNDNNKPSYLEFQSLMLATGNALLTHKHAIFHGTAFSFNGLAWIMTGPSGIGKTTQYRNWRNLYKNEIRAINGDKPILECRKDEGILVHSSPWMGKERYGAPNLCMNLGGIILLKQGSHNEIRRMSSDEAVLPLFIEFISDPENMNQIKGQAEMLNQILDTVPVWQLTNLGDDDSTRIVRKTLNDYLGGGMLHGPI